MFRVTQSPKFWSKIEVETMTEEELKPKTFHFEQQFPRMTSDELEAFTKHIVGQRLDDKDTAALLLLGTWKAVVYPVDGKVAPDEEQKKIEPMRWRGVVDGEDQPLDLSAGNVAALLANVGVGTAISKKFFADIGRAAAKN